MKNILFSFLEIFSILLKCASGQIGRREFVDPLIMVKGVVTTDNCLQWPPNPTLVIENLLRSAPPPSSTTLPVKSKLWSGNHPLLCFTSVRSEPIVNHYIAIGVRTKLTSEFGIVDSHLCSKTRGWGGMFPIASVSCTGQYLSDFSTPK